MLYTFESLAKINDSTLQVSDEVLMEAIQNEQKEALNEIYKRHHQTVRSVIGRVLHNDQSIEDLLQEVFMEVWRMAKRYSPTKGKALGWIITLSRRRAIDRLRREQAYGRVEERFREETQQQPEAWTQIDGGENVEAADMSRLINRILNELPEAQRRVVELSFYKGMSQREIAADTEVPLGTVKTRLDLAMRKIASKFKEIDGGAFALKRVA
jgi:RNA polymerase sigma-70 factor (ECF subfamily)